MGLCGLVALVTTFLPGAADAGPKPPKLYVALGDSFASGPLIPTPEEPLGCLRSTNNYAHLLAARLGVTLRDATCSGAQTDDMLGTQEVTPPPSNPPQFDRLDRDVDLVTLQIGGNDIGFLDIAFTCGEAAARQESCESQFADADPGDADDRDELTKVIDATAPKIAAVLKGIKARAPRAKVLVLGYPGFFRFGDVASCPAMGVGEGDARFLRSVQERLNDMIAATAESKGATYVDVYTPSEGRTACDLPAVRWVEPIVPVHAAVPIHPNLNGMLGVADVLEQVLHPDVYSSSDLELPPGTPVPVVPSPFSMADQGSS